MSINILHIDDEQEVSIYLDEICATKDQDVFIRWFETFDQGLEALRDDTYKFNGIILDAKCLLNTDDGVLDEQNVIKTVSEIENIFHLENIRLPYCVLSGFKESLQRYFEINNLRAFDKGEQEEDAIEYIIQSQKKVTRFKFSNEFPKIIDMGSNGLLLENDLSTIFQLYQAERQRFTNTFFVKSQIAQIRPILERILINLSNYGEYDGADLVPENYIYRKPDGKISVHNLQACFMYLNGKKVTIGEKGDIKRSKVMPDFISRQASNIYVISSDLGNHNSADTGTRDTLSMSFYSLMDILNWYNEIMVDINRN